MIILCQCFDDDWIIFVFFVHYRIFRPDNCTKTDLNGRKAYGRDGDEWRYPRCPKSFPRGFQTKTFPRKYSQTLPPS